MTEEPRAESGNAVDEPARAAAAGEPTHVAEPHTGMSDSRLNWLRAAVLGANDGIVSVAGLVVGVAGATSERAPILTAGTAGIVAGAVSMALGEYISVSSQRDSQEALLAKERRELEETPEEELAELTALYQARGLTAGTARLVARELSERDSLAAHAQIELGLDPEELTRPGQAAAASAAAFVVGALLPFVAILLPSPVWRVPITIVAVLIALGLTGWASARLGGSPALRAVLRVVVGGGLGLAATYAIGHLLGASIG